MAGSAPQDVRFAFSRGNGLIQTGIFTNLLSGRLAYPAVTKFELIARPYIETAAGVCFPIGHQIRLVGSDLEWPGKVFVKQLGKPFARGTVDISLLAKPLRYGVP